MTYIKERIRQEDRLAYQKKGIRIPAHAESWSIDRERDSLLIYRGDDRYDMGGTTNSFWAFFYQGNFFWLACNYVQNSNKEVPDFFAMEIKEIKSFQSANLKKLKKSEFCSMVNVVDFLEALTEAYTNYNRYYDDETNPTPYIHNYSFSLTMEEIR